MTDITVRAVSRDERTAWETVFEGYANFYEVTIDSTTKDNVWHWIFDDNNDFWCDVAVKDENNIVGFAQYHLMFRSLDGGKVCYMNDLFITPEARGTGSGRKLIDQVFRFAGNNGIQSVRWMTREFNYDARRLYDTYGMRSDFIQYSIPVSSIEKDVK